MHRSKCKNCKTELFHPRWKRKFCDSKCQGLHTWEKTTKPRIRKGLVSHPILLRRFLIETHGECCRLCSQGPVWKKKPLVLQLDHKNGDSDNNKPGNIRLLCPNCHTQTHTYGAKGVGNRGRKMTKRAILRRKKSQGS